MDEQGLSLEDFIGQTESAMEFIHEIIEKAVQEVDYKPNGGVMPMQVAVLPDQSVSVTLSENPKTAVADMLRGLADRLQTFLEDVQKRADHENGEVPDIEIGENPEKAPVPHFAQGAHVDAQIDDTGVHHLTEQRALWTSLERYKEVVFSFDTMNDLNRFTAGESFLTAGVGKSSLYKDRINNKFYLHLIPGQDKNSLSRLFNQATEHGSFVSGNERFILHLLEGAECLIPENALGILGNM